MLFRSPAGFDTLDLTAVNLLGTKSVSGQRLDGGVLDLNIGTLTIDNGTSNGLRVNIGDGFDQFKVDGKGLGVTVLGRDGVSEVVQLTAGNNDIDLGGGAGVTDVVSYAGSTFGVTADLSKPDSSGAVTVSFAGTGTVPASDLVSNVEGIVGGDAADILTGDSNNNLLIGGGGNDTLSGGAGNDFLYGGSGNDTLIGGTGNDFIGDFSGANSMTGDAVSGTTRGKDIFAVAGGVGAGGATDAASLSHITDYDLAPALTALPGRGFNANDSVIFFADLGASFGASGNSATTSWTNFFGGNAALASAAMAAVASNDLTQWHSFVQTNIYSHLSLILEDPSTQSTVSKDRLFEMVFKPDADPLHTIKLAEVKLDNVANIDLTQYQLGVVTLTDPIGSMPVSEILLNNLATNPDHVGAIGMRGAVEMDRIGTLTDSLGNDVIVGSSAANIIVASGGDDVLSGRRGADSYQYLLQDFNTATADDYFGHDLITDWGSRGSTDADQIFIEGARISNLSFHRTTYAREASGASLNIEASQGTYNADGTFVEQNHGLITVFNQYSQSQSAYRIENLVLNEYAANSGGAGFHQVFDSVSGNPITHVYELARVAGVATGVSATATQSTFAGGGDLIQAVSQNDAIFVGSLNKADEFRLNMPTTNVGGTATKVVRAFLSDVDNTDRIDVANSDGTVKDLWTLLKGDAAGHNYSVEDFNAQTTYVSGVPATVHNNRMLNVTVDSGTNASSTADDTVLRVIFMSGATADDYLAAHGLAHY